MSYKQREFVQVQRYDFDLEEWQKRYTLTPVGSRDELKFFRVIGVYGKAYFDSPDEYRKYAGVADEDLVAFYAAADAWRARQGGEGKE